MNICEESKKYK